MLLLFIQFGEQVTSNEWPVASHSTAFHDWKRVKILALRSTQDITGSHSTRVYGVLEKTPYWAATNFI